MKRFASYVFCLLMILGLAAIAHSYILPAEQILSFMIDQFGSGRTLRVTQKTVLYDPVLEGGMQEHDETLYYWYPDRFRSEASGPGVEQVRVVNTEGALSILDGKIIGETEQLFDHFKDVLLYLEIELLVDRLTQLGISLEVVSLGRFKDQIAYVIGAKYPDESVPQVWIDKNTFRPIRLILSGGDAPLREIEYTDYKSLGKNRFYPGRILFFENGTLIRMHVSKAHKMNLELVDQLFDVAHLKGTYEPIVPALTPPAPASDLDEMKKSIQDFKKLFE